ncbi:uncharacterized protein [Blastocystis hominis]|uniref:P-type ATPase C-terminal domain-containing protein n=1 Tax=Blastocystis hominis TaxID=12968 RepID=D8M1J4_BLAHO|nr:uncharacterized protein [Blastocystis hominis]CBK21933.2 unnamed protein product [Blastocystis hominis]|eukprot:XP_012895981.1 uncharacterized protein [Blastocystis hominis]
MTKNGPNSGSPDELALLHGFKQLGGFILAKDETVVRLRLPRGGEETWKIERVNAFSSERKRMSVVVRNGETGEIRLYMKVRNRADFCHPGSRRQRASPLRPQSRGSGFGPAVAFAGNAARLPHHGVRLPRFFVRSVGRLRGALRFRGNRGEIAGPSSGLDVSPRGSVQCSEEDVERDADALGTCAIEDSLQEGVSETFLRKGGIRFWLITGDHVETSLQISRQSKILQCDETKLLRLEGASANELRAAWDRAKASLCPAGRSLVLTGRSLAAIFAWADCLDFFKTAVQFDSVLCCRVTPKQKAEIVRWVQKASKHVTLAIGDGGNDVSMLLQSDCGVGIRGREGEQAARAGDFVVREFRSLVRLLCVHGARDRSRSWTITGYSLYKSVVLCGCQTMYSLFTLFSGASLFCSLHLTFYSIVLFVFSFFFYFAHSRSPSSDSSSNAFTPTRTFSPTRSSTPTPTAPRPSIRRPTPSAASSPFSRSRWRRA